jgi:hypothetical protein
MLTLTKSATIHFDDDDISSYNGSDIFDYSTIQSSDDYYIASSDDETEPDNDMNLDELLHSNAVQVNDFCHYLRCFMNVINKKSTVEEARDELSFYLGVNDDYELDAEVIRIENSKLDGLNYIEAVFN